MRHPAWLLILALCLGCAGLAAPVRAATPAVGSMAPAFHLEDQNGHWRSPADYRGEWLVLYFYPKDFTPGCTTEVCTFRDDLAKLRQAGARVVGVSLDDVASHAEFAAKYQVPFPLLADTKHAAAEAYGVLSAHGDAHYAARTTFLIDPEGRLAEVWTDVDPEANSAQVLAALAARAQTAR